jgi:hypothetical protein
MCVPISVNIYVCLCVCVCVCVCIYMRMNICIRLPVFIPKASRPQRKASYTLKLKAVRGPHVGVVFLGTE